MSRFRPDTFTLLLLATVLLASLVPVRGAAAHVFSIVAQCAIALLFFLHGARIARKTALEGLSNWRLHLMVLASTFGLFPLLGLAVAHLAPGYLTPTLITGVLFLCVLPSTVQSSIAFTSMAGGNVPAAICAASGSNIIGMFLTPLLVALLFSVSGGGFSWDVLRQILLQLLLPFVLGQMVQPRLGPWLAARKRVVGVVDRGSILMVVYLAFSEAMVEELWQRTSLDALAVMAGVDVLLLGLVLTVTLGTSRLLRFSREDEITIVFCGSKKSLASGIPMANVIFAGQDIGGIVLPLMLFHQIQLIACAQIARRYARRPLPADDAALIDALPEIATAVEVPK